VNLIPTIEKPEIRSQGRTRIARSGMEGAAKLLAKAVDDPGLTYLERMDAAVGLGLVDNDPEGLQRAMEIAKGRALPVGDLGERAADHPERDLRSGAILAVMKRGDQDYARELLKLADAPGADPALARMVDHQLVGFTGGDLTHILFERIGRRKRVSLGEAQYLNAHATRGDVERLEALINVADRQDVRDLLRAAAMNAARRE
jgi:hypothetical protein